MDTIEKLGVAFLILIIGLVFVVLPAALFFGVNAPTSGEHTGYITATEQSGIFWKTWKVYVKTDTQSSQEDTYCVQDETLIPILKSLQESKKLTTFTYHTELLTPLWLCGSDNQETIVSVK